MVGWNRAEWGYFMNFHEIWELWKQPEATNGLLANREFLVIKWWFFQSNQWRIGCLEMIIDDPDGFINSSWIFMNSTTTRSSEIKRWISVWSHRGIYESISCRLILIQNFELSYMLSCFISWAEEFGDPLKCPSLILHMRTFEEWLRKDLELLASSWKLLV